VSLCVFARRSIDVNKPITLLGNLGVKKIQRNGPGSVTQSDEVNVGYPLKPKHSRKKVVLLRGSIMIVVRLARFGKGYISKPGGDKIGRRRLIRTLKDL
jgi:UDP-N-acetylglucosamine 1-carboxyvinyltransferase